MRLVHDLERRAGVHIVLSFAFALAAALLTPACDSDGDAADDVQTGAGTSAEGDGASGSGGSSGMNDPDAGGAVMQDASSQPTDGALPDGASDGGTDPEWEECEPLSQRDCYTGATETEGEGACAAGVATCNADGTAYGDCEGEVLPARATCDSGGDLDCNGIADDAQDSDEDGYTLCDGDCCDAPEDGCEVPELVNPGAFDYPGDELDDDCSGAADDAVTCDDGLVSDSSSPVDYTHALDLCQETMASPPQAERRWGLVQASFARADGTGAVLPVQRAIRPDFGAITAQQGAGMIVLSTGHAAAWGDTNPDYADFQQGQSLGSSSNTPADWLADNGGALPRAPGCPAADSTTAHDPVMLTLQVRVPTNARAFTVSTYFLSAEYPEWVCSPYNDFFVALLDSEYDGTPANPADGNLAVYTNASDQHFPIGVNLAYGNTGLFRQCVNGTTGCLSGAVSSEVDTCVATADLAGTGFDGTSTTCNTNDLVGGGTGWLRVGGNVVPGETMTLRLAIWDTGDGTFDSLVLLDGFSWLAEPITPGSSL